MLAFFMEGWIVAYCIAPSAWPEGAGNYCLQTVAIHMLYLLTFYICFLKQPFDRQRPLCTSVRFLSHCAGLLAADGRLHLHVAALHRAERRRGQVLDGGIWVLAVQRRAAHSHR